jgi:hypothetical protein
MQITIDLSRLNATELAYLSKMRIGQLERESVYDELVSNCGPVVARNLQTKALTDIDTLESRAQ